MPVLLQADAANLLRAAEMLREGKLVAFPTETVYGLGGDATNDKAVAAIYAAKGRPTFNPLIIHVAETDALNALVEWNDDARLLAQHFWPGPMTLVLPRRKDAPVSLLASAGLDTLAVRVPSHPIAQKLLRETGRPIAAPSANASGRLSPTTPLHVMESLGDKVDLILAGGKTSVGVESTVIDMTAAPPTLLRPGGVTIEELQHHLSQIKLTPHAVSDTPQAPGMLVSHYAPNAFVRLNATNVSDDEALLAFGPDLLIKGGAERLNLSPEGDLSEAAANLFSMLRLLDKPGLRSIAVMPIPEVGLGLAINDRLRRASAPRG